MTSFFITGIKYGILIILKLILNDLTIFYLCLNHKVQQTMLPIFSNYFFKIKYCHLIFSGYRITWNYTSWWKFQLSFLFETIFFFFQCLCKCTHICLGSQMESHHIAEGWLMTVVEMLSCIWWNSLCWLKVDEPEKHFLYASSLICISCSHSSIIYICVSLCGLLEVSTYFLTQ